MKKIILIFITLFFFTSYSNESKIKTQTLNLFLGSEPKTLDLSISSDNYALEIISLINEGLVNVKNIDNEDTVVPAGAESWTTSKDGLVWTFNLRKNSLWSDGKPVTAKDYYYGITRTLNPKTAASYAFILYPIKNAKNYNEGKIPVENIGIKVIDDFTLEVILENPTPYFLDLAYFRAMFPQREDFIMKYNDSHGSEHDKIIGNGPYILKKWVHNNMLSLEKNNNYWNEKNFKLDKINFLIVPDENSRMSLLLNGTIDIATVSKPEWMNTFEKSNKFNYLNNPSLGVNYNTFNTKSRYFKNLKIRQAVALAIDRNELNQIMFNGTYLPAYGWVSNGIQINGKEYRTLFPGPLKAIIDKNIDPKELFIQGLKELNEDPVLEKVTISFITTGTSPFHKKYSELLQGMLKKKLGINLKIEFLEWPVYQKRTQEMNYELGGQGSIADYNDPNSFLERWTSTTNFIPTGWSNKEYDTLIELARKTNNNDDRLEYFKRAETILIAEDTVIAPTLYRMNSIFIKKSLINYNPPKIGPYNYENVYLDNL